MTKARSHGKNGRIVKLAIGAIVVLLLVGGIGAYFVWQQIRQQSADNAKIISETNGIAYQDLGSKAANQRSKALFGKDVDILAKTNLKKQLHTADQAQQAATVLAAGGQYSKSVEAYQIAASLDPSGVSSYYETYANVLDDAGDHTAATALYQQELDRLKKEDPTNAQEIAKVAGQLANRKELFP